MSRKYTFDNESNILSYYRTLKEKPLGFPQSDDLWRIYQSTIDDEAWKKWRNTSGKSDVPPDFVNHEAHIMMEVMRFDDQAKNSGKTNEAKAKENRTLNEFNKSGIFDVFPNVREIHINSPTDLNTNDDHNYKRFQENFNRVVTKHSKKSIQYRLNYPMYKLVFFVFDESSGVYFETNETIKVKINMNIIAAPHFYWIDQFIVETIKNCGADYLIWFKPYNSFRTPSGTNDDFPKVIIYDVKNMKLETKNYDCDLMFSSEI
jgi:hypothetical protein